MPEVRNRASSAMAFWIPAFSNSTNSRCFKQVLLGTGMTNIVALLMTPLLSLYKIFKSFCYIISFGIVSGRENHYSSRIFEFKFHSVKFGCSTEAGNNSAMLERYFLDNFYSIGIFRSNFFIILSDFLELS